MIRLLRPFLLVLVLLNVAFVHLTGVVGLEWLAPLYVLTLVSPLLARRQHNLVYRLSWNLAVVALSLVLLNHALTTGLLHLLEDGLVLAALCQVHLLNNVGARQRPDLLFFNSFLIAFVTSFFCQDAAYSALFLVYAAVLIPALQVFAAVRVSEDPPRGLLPLILRDSLPKTAAALAVTSLVFLFWPRDFHREGWLEGTIGLSGRQLAVDFSDEVRVSRSGDTFLSDSEVFRVGIRQGEPSLAPPHWRGATFIDFRGGGWIVEPTMRSTLMAPVDEAWERDGAGRWQRPAGQPEILLEVRLRDPAARRVFLPLLTGEFELMDGNGRTRPDGTVTFERQYDRSYGSEPLLYRVSVCEPAPQPLRLPPPSLQRLTLIEPELVPREVFDLARTLRSKLPETASHAVLADTYSNWLASHLRYALPGERGAARGLTQFLAGSGGGHCEFFATTLALMLRTQAVPCRVVTGYLATEFDEQSGELIVRKRHAHAWVEVFLRDRGWITMDPTPAGTGPQRTAGESLWDDLGETITGWWNAVTGFDEEARHRALEWLRQLPGRIAMLPCTNPWSTGAMTVLLGTWLLLRGRRGNPSIRSLHRAARAAGLRLRPGETPRELLCRAAATEVSPRRMAALTTATRLHEAARYGGEPTGLPARSPRRPAPPLPPPVPAR